MKKTKKKETQAVFSSPFDEAFKSPFETDELKIQYSSRDPQMIKNAVNELLNLRDHLIKQATFRGLRNTLTSMDNEKANIVEFDGYYAKEHTIFGGVDGDFDDHEHIYLEAKVKGKLAQKIIQKRIYKGKFPIFKYRPDITRKIEISNDENYSATMLYMLACRLSKHYIMSRISQQIKDYLQTYGKENCNIHCECQNEHYTLKLSHYEVTDAVVPEESDEITIALPDQIYQLIKTENASKEYLNLAFYDNEWETLFDYCDEVQLAVRKQIGDKTHPMRPRKPRRFINWPKLPALNSCLWKGITDVGIGALISGLVLYLPTHSSRLMEILSPESIWYDMYHELLITIGTFASLAGIFFILVGVFRIFYGHLYPER